MKTYALIYEGITIDYVTAPTKRKAQNMVKKMYTQADQIKLKEI